MTAEFRRYTLAREGELFDALARAVRFERVAKGRRGAVLVQPDATRGVPIVRTTTRYDAAAQRFSPVHERVAHQVQALASLPTTFNNALIERYTNAYATMGYHSDQAQDLEPGSSIAIVSCYRDPARASPPRALLVRSKQPGSEAFEIPLTHQSVVVFSLDSNRRFTHKIVLDRTRQPPENEWLGVTFRTSRTFVQYREDGVFLEAGDALTVADEDQRRALYKLRGRENRETDFAYPPLTYTISASDTTRPR
ncbi:MAG: alpha-ketoglutarate-dependent dioxygenase AlkB [Myxococcales bacterium]|nr:alpha-ketoglutarate-dependent dioxygenase AlkB [Myxococcales bacterium]